MKKTYQAPNTHIIALKLESSLLDNSIDLHKSDEAYDGEFTTKEDSWSDIWE